VDEQLNDIEVRVLGVLMEKEKPTPEYYPLTLNALTRACNQKSNRNPVVSFDETTVVRTLDKLTFEQNLVKRVMSDDTRVAKYRHDFRESLGLDEREMAVLCILMLRGPQTVGEIRGRTERLFPFESLEEVENTLTNLADREAGTLATKLPRQPGRKEARFAHLLAGEVEVDEVEFLEPAVVEVLAENERMDRLENEMDQMKEQLEQLKTQF
jgi:uncharacterized protein YceH (UPF0502 family)